MATQRTRSGRFPSSADQANTREAAILSRYGKQTLSGLWDYSTDGGAADTFLLGTRLPANAVVTTVMVDEQSAVAGATNIVVEVGSTAVTSAIDFTGQAGTVKYATLAGGASAIKLANGGEIRMTRTGAAATAGKVRYAVEFYTSE